MRGYRKFNRSWGNPYVNNISISSGTSGTVGDPDNYQLPSLASYSAADNALTINKKPLTIVDGSLESADKFYDGDNTAIPSGTPLLQSFVTTGSNANDDNNLSVAMMFHLPTAQSPQLLLVLMLLEIEVEMSSIRQSPMQALPFREQKVTTIH